MHHYTVADERGGTDLVAALDEFDRYKLASGLESHELRHPEVAAPDVLQLRNPGTIDSQRMREARVARARRAATQPQHSC